MTKSKKIRAYLAKHPSATAKELQEKFDTSLSMAYRLLQEARTAARAAEISLCAAMSIEDQNKMADDAHQFFNAIELNPPSMGFNGNTSNELVIVTEANTAEDKVNNPRHYTVGGIETIDFIEAKGLHHHYYLANAIKYISRAPYKDNYLEDVKKAAWYLQREIDRAETRKPA